MPQTNLMRQPQDIISTKQKKSISSTGPLLQSLSLNITKHLKVLKQCWTDKLLTKCYKMAKSLTVDVHLTLRAVQVALFRHNDVLDVFHGQVIAEGVI